MKRLSLSPIHFLTFLHLCVAVLIALFTLNTWAATDLNSEMSALGANKELMKKAKAIDPHNRVRVVQNREVDRHMRLEIGVNYGMAAAGGDPYLNTSIFGGQLDFHITPRWSLGARYSTFNNTLNSEGQQVFNEAAAQKAAGNSNYRYPGVAYAKNSWLLVADWYPVYGKLNLFDASIAQFDLYIVGGAGQITLDTGTAPLYTAGGGVGVWMTKHIATRLEARWQGYNDKVWDGANYIGRKINETILSATLSFIL